MSIERKQCTYPDEDHAREAVQQSLEWINAHVLVGKEGGQLKVEVVQQFSMTAPGPASDEPKTPRESCSMVVAEMCSECVEF